MLIQLPNGSWVNPACVVSVTDGHKTAPEGTKYDWRVEVEDTLNTRHNCRVESENEAIALRDKLAETINASCAWEIKGGPPC